MSRIVLSEAALVAEKLMLLKGQEILGAPLQEIGWKFKFDNAKRRLGCCRYNNKIISISRYWVQNNGCCEEIEDTIKHEIAHAVDFEQRGYSNHDRIWKSKAILCGAIPERCGNVDNLKAPKSRYQGLCLSCKTTYEFHRFRSEFYYCNRCMETIHVIDTKNNKVRQKGGKQVQRN